MTQRTLLAANSLSPSMTDQVSTLEAGAQPQETTGEVENLATEQQENLQPEETQEEQTPPPQKVVPLAALHEEREEKKRLRQQMKTMEERFAQLSQVVTQRLQPPPQPEAEIPDVSVDPVAHFRAKTEMLERQLQELRQPVQQMTQQSEQERAINALKAHVAAQEQQFVQQAPDYAEALSHMQALSVQGLRAMGYDDAQARNLMHQQYLGLAHRIATQGGNVAQHIYEMAKENGYTPKGQVSEQDKLAALKKGTAAARSLGGGGNATTRLSLAALAEMPAEEFAKTIGDEDAWRKLWS